MTTELYHFSVGAFDCIVVSDGTFAYPHPAQTLISNAAAEHLWQALHENGLDTAQWEHYVSPYPSLVVNTGGHLVLVDTWAGDLATDDWKASGQPAGRGDLPGNHRHTPGHMAVAVGAGRVRLLHVVDAVLHPIHLEHPEWYSALDLLPERTVDTRLRLLEEAAVDRVLCLPTISLFIAWATSSRTGKLGAGNRLE